MAATSKNCAVYASETISTIVILLIAIVSSIVSPPAALTFTEQDPAFSFQLTIPETVPVASLIGLSAGIPIALVLVMHVFPACTKGSPTNFTLRSACRNLAWLALCFAQCMCLTLAVTGWMKISVGRQRPNFFAMCNYQGYDDAIQSGNFTSYFAKTQHGVFGSLSKCMASEDWIWEAQKSFPSGHASISFAGMTWVTLYLRTAFGVANNVHVTLPALLAASPLVISTWVSISRVRDRWHNTDDIAVGAFIGIMSAVVVWWHYRSQRTAGKSHATEPAESDPRSSQRAQSLLVDDHGDDKIILPMPA